MAAKKKTKKPDATRCGLCGAMCTDPTEVSRHHKDDCSRHPDNRPKPSKKLKPAAVAKALGASSHEPVRGDGTQQYMEGRAKHRTPRPPWPKGPSVIPPPEPRKNPGLFNKETGMAWEHTHETTGSNGCNACFVEATAPRVGGQAWADFTQELIGKLGFMPRYPGLTDEQHLVELIGPTWAEDAKKKWVVNWTVDGYLARRPHLKAKPRAPSTGGALDKYAHAEAETSWPRWINALLRLLGHDPNQDKMSLELYMQAHGINRDDALDKYARDWTVEEYVSKNPQLRGRGKAHEGSSRWYVEVTKRGVSFNIDHQGFLLRDDYDPEDGLTKEQHYAWYARQLTVAFKRLTGES
jgi:hypothetical protein